MTDAANLPLADLADRHPGLTQAIGDGYFEAASVCLDRHHVSPAILICEKGAGVTDCNAVWISPSAGVLGAWANELDTTEAGAYCVSLAAVELVEGLVAMRRAETLTGADYYIAPVGTIPEDLESCLRLEVSGVNAGDRSIIEARLSAKLAQAQKGKSNLPAMAAVVGFKERLIMIASVSPAP